MRIVSAVVLWLLWGVSTPRMSAAASPHQQTLAQGVEAIGFADRYRSANCGWVTAQDETLLIDLPRGVAPADFLKSVADATGKPARAMVLTHATPEDVGLVKEYLTKGIKTIYLSPRTYQSLMGSAHASDKDAPSRLPTSVCIKIDKPMKFGDDERQITLLPLDDISSQGAAAVYVSEPVKVLFAGPLVHHGPRVPLPGTDTQQWIATLEQLETELNPTHVVPGFGSWGGGERLHRQRKFLGELRRQVAYFVAQGRPLEDLSSAISIPADYLVWMPYDTPVAEDLNHVYAELTVPHAPFAGKPPDPDSLPPHALVLIGDQPHEPGHIEAGLRPVFKATGVVPHFAVDVRAVSAENLARVRLLVILRDGLQRPKPNPESNLVWMTPEQEQAIVDFVERGGGFLNLHNSMGLYPDNGPYLKLVGGRYNGHGPLERFRVEVVDRQHPVTQGVEDFSVADEQHTPPYDESKVHLLLRNRSDDGQTAAAGWAYEPAQGRLCHLANGHTREALEHPMYQRLLQNATRWCLRMPPIEPNQASQ